MSKHISSAFNDDLQMISIKISEMGGICEEMLKSSLQALYESDIDLANSVITTDQKIDKLEKDIEELVIKTIALRNPVADDLRQVFSAIKISAALERIGDYSKNIAKRTLIISNEHISKLRKPILDLGNKVCEQLHKALNSFEEKNHLLAKKIWHDDFEIDKMYEILFQELKIHLEKKSNVNVGSNLMFVAKNLERIGDHTTHISEMIYYVITGSQIDTERPKVDFTNFKA